MSTTKLTRKEILAEDPVHHAIIQVVEVFRERGKLIAAGAAGVLVIALGVYFGIQYLDSRESIAQQRLAKGMDFFHARIDPNALDDPYGKGSEPLFRTEEARYKAAASEFSAVAASSSSSKPAVIARYYLGLTQLRLGQKEQAVKTLEAVRENSKDRTIAYLAKKVLAGYYLDAGNIKVARELLEGMIKDPQCELPKSELQLNLARALEAQGKRDEAIKVLREARESGGGGMLASLVTQELSRLEGNSR